MGIFLLQYSWDLAALMQAIILSCVQELVQLALLALKPGF